MPLADALPPLMGILGAAVGAYFLSFRRDPHAKLLGAAIVLLGAYLVFWRTDTMRMPWPENLLGLASMLAIAAFLALYPTPPKAASATTAVLAVMAVWSIGSALFLIVGGPGDYSQGGAAWEYALSPISLGASSLLTLLGVARMHDLPRDLDDHQRAARTFTMLAAPFTLVGGGFTTVRCVAALFGAADPPIWMLRPADPGLITLAVLTWWVAPGLFILYGLLKWRWLTPMILFVAGALSFVPILFKPDLPLSAVVNLRSWGALVVPALVLYAQARWTPLSGEPRGALPGIALTATAAACGYAFTFIGVLILAPTDRWAFALGPVLGLAVAATIAYLVHPNSRRLRLRGLFVGASAPWAPRLEEGTVLLGRYRVIRLIAEGGQARVYEAVDRREGNRHVVLKAVLDEQARTEANVLRRLRHPNIVGFHDVIESAGLALLVLQHEPGGDLRQCLARGPVPTDEALHIARGILAGLAAAHADGVTHRDLKPENILLGADGSPRLTDFGAARLAAGGRTARIADLGTLAYVAPEQVRGEPGDARSDVYAAAVLLHELLAHTPPVNTRHRDDFAVRRSILEDAPVLKLPTSVRALRPLFERALSKDPAARFSSASAMLESFDDCLDRSGNGRSVAVRGMLAA